MATKTVFQGERDVIMYAELWHAANSLLQIADEQPRGSAFVTLSSLLMRMFSLEAYLNHLGEGVLKLWTPKPHLPVREKLRLVAAALQVSVDDTVRPYSTVEGLIQFRNELAHGRTTRIEGTVDVDPNDRFSRRLFTAYEKFNTIENARFVKEDVNQIVVGLQAAAGLSAFPWIMGATTGWEGTVPSDQS